MVSARATKYYLTKPKSINQEGCIGMAFSNEHGVPGYPYSAGFGKRASVYRLCC
jgi:hypothetical protein